MVIVIWVLVLIKYPRYQSHGTVHFARCVQDRRQASRANLWRGEKQEKENKEGSKCALAAATSYLALGSTESVTCRQMCHNYYQDCSTKNILWRSDGWGKSIRGKVTYLCFGRKRENTRLTMLHKRHWPLCQCPETDWEVCIWRMGQNE